MASLQGYVDRELHAFCRWSCHAHHVHQPVDRVLLILQDGRAIVVSRPEACFRRLNVADAVINSTSP